jgi:hypothetical protein
MRLRKAIGILRYYFEFVPFKTNFIIYCLVVVASFKIINSYKTDTNSFIALTLLMAKIALIFSIIIVIISFLSTLISSLYFYFRKKNNPDQAIEIGLEVNPQQHNTLSIATKIPHALKPILGFVLVKLFYDKQQSTDKYLLADRIKKQFIPFKSGLSGQNSLLLPDIKEYYFSKAIVYFEDMLQFFAFAFPGQVNSTILNMPHSLLYNPQEFTPKKTEEEKIRIEQLRKVEGEYLNYKKFEDSDDVRRIVWKIFAKNKELVVRTPEVMDPFASHIYMYASFYNAFSYDLYDNYASGMLNYYKNCVWTIFETLAKQAFEIKFISDQHNVANKQQIEIVRRQITVSNWHHHQSIADYFKPKHASILCIHSFSQITDVENLISRYEAGTTIFFVQLSKVFKSYYVWNWLTRIFLKAPENEFSKLKAKWAIHPLKFKLQSNESKIIELLKQGDIHFEIL